ncbi:2,4-dichlorophenol 6-monooxygenase [Fulvia fulva]|uniref:2,4-dichlorophenol 6-monooxygenase n=1 Tax=Passalora fulva TaxID=5499 RepID=A0A9Q8PM56_PASFU|nr:2,4-dichlorophenol 6-monooxygenase [Fulvia fulva]KAK4609592.1 2,4-dichlorophenol 6-monooxygenase [Fulvia fulva]UJO25071.1 2,4-dichlorophenol 6-monooxygenase [Fulvia fulva]WPV22534.1 2,4-dichlorophenol 6-monooxygenase [Fulvia fulva]
MGSIEQPPATLPVLDADVLIVGAGPSGAALACFLGSHGIKGVMVSNAKGPSPTPRANCQNMAAFECLRDIDLEQAALEVSHTVEEYSTYNRICKSLVGAEIYRAYTFGNDPKRHGDYADASPCKTACLPQDQLEPILLARASERGWSVRFETELVHFQQNEQRDIVETELEHAVTGQRYVVRSRFMCGADGPQSKIVKELDFPLNVGPGGGLAINVWIEADMGHLMTTTPALLSYLTRPDLAQPMYGMMGLAHFIKPWSEWVISLICHPAYQKVTATEDEIMARVKELIGDDTIPMKLKNISVWKTEEVYAEHYSKGNIHCLGDAVHRHPPFGGLGSNTCIQDAFNLAWKLAYVLKGHGGPSLLQTYSTERQPIGNYVVGRANDNGRLNMTLYGMLGVFDPDIQRRSQVDELLKADSEEGEQMRNALRNAIRALDDERHGLGGEMNQWYKSDAVYTGDETEEPYWPSNNDELALHHTVSTYPGFRVPHAWLGQATTKPGPRPPLVSTRDLCGHGKFSILTGIGGKEAWTNAATWVTKTLGVEIDVHSIGWGQDYEDTFFTWFDKRGVGEKGAVLVRPDRTVAWRCKDVPAAGAVERLENVLKLVLARY